MKCPEIAPFVPRFFDGELDGAHMRTVALHITRCRECEDELRGLDRLQSLVAERVTSEAEGVNLDSVWSAVSARIEDVPRPWTQRLGAWWEDFELLAPAVFWPALGTAAAVLLTVNFWSTGPAGSAGKTAKVESSRVAIAHRVAKVNKAERMIQKAMAEIDNSAVFESIVGEVDHLLVEPQTQTAVLWINDTGEFR